MKECPEFFRIAAVGHKAMRELEEYLRVCGLEQSLLHLVQLRASQINSGAFFADIHEKDLFAPGEEERRYCSLEAGNESPLYTDRACAALVWTEAITLVGEGGIVPDIDYDLARMHFNEKELSDLTLAILTINAWNQICNARKALQEKGEPSEEER